MDANIPPEDVLILLYSSSAEIRLAVFEQLVQPGTDWTNLSWFLSTSRRFPDDQTDGVSYPPVDWIAALPSFLRDDLLDVCRLNITGLTSLIIEESFERGTVRNMFVQFDHLPHGGFNHFPNLTMVHLKLDYMVRPFNQNAPCNITRAIPLPSIGEPEILRRTRELLVSSRFLTHACLTLNLIEHTRDSGGYDVHPYYMRYLQPHIDTLFRVVPALHGLSVRFYNQRPNTLYNKLERAALRVTPIPERIGPNASAISLTLRRRETRSVVASKEVVYIRDRTGNVVTRTGLDDTLRRFRRMYAQPTTTTNWLFNHGCCWGDYPAGEIACFKERRTRAPWGWTRRILGVKV
ncbi:hypothetical protein BT63DRAFT_418821 [Microthyrium microscopicum]|uniref:Uncharacterized protein n=1 Tax=Microthyrium microscopicum TaxID=703497 RepID=A0A6A6TV37_9PEZI|nr:hypothetical protein BT63DRAFT_418821 [Microthyrium microscopicum]